MGLPGGDRGHGLGSGIDRAASPGNEKKLVGFSRDPAKIEVLSEAGPGATTIVLNGRIMWWGKRQLTGEMNRFRNAAEVAARRSPDRQ